MPEEKEYLTIEKFEEFTKELEYLRKTRRKEVAQNLEYAKALGDLAENSEYHEARDVQANIEDRISRLESILKTAVIVSSHDSNKVSVGSVVTVTKDKNDKAQTYTIVGSEESDPSSGKISVKSPLGSAVLGKKKGDNFSFRVPTGTANYKVVDIK